MADLSSQVLIVDDFLDEEVRRLGASMDALLAMVSLEITESLQPAPGLFGEPAEEFSGVGGFALCVGPGLAVFERDQAGEVLKALGEQVKRSA